MARRRNRSTDSGFAAFIIIIGVTLYGFYQANAEIIEIIFFVVVGLLVVGGAVFLSIKLTNAKKRKDTYLNSHYYKETQYPFHRYINEPGRSFEAQVFNEIRDAIEQDYPMLTNLSLPQMDAFNVDSQIDLVVLHSTGLYVIEIKDFNGPLIGRFDEDVWKPYVLKKVKNKKSNKFEDQYEINWGLYNSFRNKGYSNPIKQNNIHIRTVNQLIPALYENAVIFSDPMFVDNGQGSKSIAKGIYSLSDFIAKLTTESPKYNLIELQQMGTQLASYNRQSDQQDKLHRARVK